MPADADFFFFFIIDSTTKNFLLSRAFLSFPEKCDHPVYKVHKIVSCLKHSLFDSFARTDAVSPTV